MPYRDVVPRDGAVRVLALAAALSLTVRPASAQQLRVPMVGDAAVDSASVARAAYREARTAASPHDAARLLLRATSAWPSQPAYWLAQTSASVATHDLGLLRTSVAALMTMHQAPALGRDSLLRSWIARTGSEGWFGDFERAVAPVRSAVPAAHVPAPIFVEGIDVDPHSGRLYATSVRTGSVLRCEAGGFWRDLELARDARIQAVFAVRVAPDSAYLWVSSATHALRANPASGQRAAQAGIARVRAHDGTVVEWHDLPPAERAHMPGDLLALPNGDVLVSDSDAAQLYLWRAREGAWQVISHVAFRSPQGMAYVSEQHAVLVADYSHGLYLVHLNTRAVSRVADTPGTSVLGLDGLAWHDGHLYAVQNGTGVPQLLVIALTDDLRMVRSVRVADRQPDLAPSPSTVVSLPNAVLYVGNSPWESFETGGVATMSTPTPLLRLDVRPRSRRGTRTVAVTPSPLSSCNRSSAVTP
jgi:hypothetical protein